jgi:hypothetical protein
MGTGINLVPFFFERCAFFSRSSPSFGRQRAQIRFGLPQEFLPFHGHLADPPGDPHPRLQLLPPPRTLFFPHRRPDPEGEPGPTQGLAPGTQ